MTLNRVIDGTCMVLRDTWKSLKVPGFNSSNLNDVEMTQVLESCGTGLEFVVVGFPALKLALKGHSL